MTSQYKHVDEMWVAVDLDGTVLEMVVDLREFGDLRVGCLETLEMIRGLGFKIVIFTSRPTEQINRLATYLRDKFVPFDAIWNGWNFKLFASWSQAKPLAELYIDDRAFVHKDWLTDHHPLARVLHEIKKNRENAPWLLK